MMKSLKNMKRYFFALLFLFLNLSGYAQNEEYYPFKKKTLWGVITGKGNVTVIPKYDKIGFFDVWNMATVEQNGKEGIINEKGDIIVNKTVLL